MYCTNPQYNESLTLYLVWHVETFYQKVILVLTAKKMVTYSWREKITHMSLSWISSSFVMVLALKHQYIMHVFYSNQSGGKIRLEKSIRGNT